MQAAFRVRGQGEAGPCPGRVVGGYTKPPLAKGKFHAVVLGRSYGFPGAHACNTRVTEFPIMKPPPPRADSCTRKTKCVLVVPLGCSEGARGDVYGRWCRHSCWPSATCTSATRRTARSSSGCAPGPTTTGCSSPVTSRRPSPTSAGRSRPSPAASARSSGRPATTSCGPIPRTPSPCAASPATSTSSRCAATWASPPPRTPTRSGTAPAARSPWPRCSCCTTTPSCRPGCTTKEEGLAYAHGTGVVCTDEFLLHPDPYPTREAWCRARVAETERRLAALARRPAHRPRQPLPAGPAPDGRPAVPRVRHVVRHRG